MTFVRHPTQRSSRLSERDSLFEQVPPARWPEPIPVGDASESEWAEFERWTETQPAELDAA